MKRSHFDKAMDDLAQTWKYGPLEVECLWEAVQKLGLTAFLASLKDRIRARGTDKEFRPPMSSLITWIKSTQAAREPEFTEEYLELRDDIEAGRIDRLWWKVRERAYPAVVMSGYVYIMDTDGPGYPGGRVVTPKTLGVTVFRPHQEAHANA